MDANLDPPYDIQYLVNRDLSGYTELLELLQSEKQLLVNRDFDTFAAVLERKHALLTVLDAQTKLRLNLLTSRKLSSDETGMQALIEQQPEYGRETLIANWADLKKIVMKCNRQNEVNAKIAHRAQTTSRQILNILKGAPISTNLYGKSGTAKGSDAGLSITRA